MGRRHGLAGLLRRLWSLTKGSEDCSSEVPNEPREIDDERDIERVLETFRALIAQLTQDGKQLSQLCERAERKAAHYALLNETVIESVSSGILVFDRSHRLLLANSSAKRILDLDVGTRVSGMALDGLFREGHELSQLVRRSLDSGTNASREIREVVTLAGKSLRLGISVSCVGPDPSSVEGAIVVFTSLSEDTLALSESQSDAAKTLERQNYLRGVLDSYDIISGLFMDFDRIEQKTNSGTLTISELREFSGSLRQACDILMAFALSLGAIDSIPELVDVSSLLETVIARTGFEGDSRLRRRLGKGLPTAKTLRKVLEVGLGLLIKGCMSQSRDGIEITSGVETGPTGCSLYIDVRELSPSKPVRTVGGSLREFVGGGDMQREAGLFLLASLPPAEHVLETGQADGVFRFSLRISPPIDKEVRQDEGPGKLSDGKRDENL